MRIRADPDPKHCFFDSLLSFLELCSLVLYLYRYNVFNVRTFLTYCLRFVILLKAFLHWKWSTVFGYVFFFSSVYLCTYKVDT